MPVFSIVALMAYLLSLGLIIPSLLRKNSAYRRLALVSAVVALICHAIALQQRIFDVSAGQNLSLLNIGSIVSLIICSVMTFVASRDRGWFLLPIVYSFAMINGLRQLYARRVHHSHGSQPGTDGAYRHGAVLLRHPDHRRALRLAARRLDYLLKNKRLTFSADMPPLMSIERKMFHITQIGVVLLTLTLCTGLLYMDNLFSKENVHKAVLSIMAGSCISCCCGAIIMRAGAAAASSGSASPAPSC